ncbi:MAG: bacterial Ig-like domain-containing protein [Clostridia bacterium]|nr:bacterial Ig-like domain-containing protein [Clostridia bacterium]
MKKLLCTVLSTVFAISSAAALNMSAYADSTNTQQVSYNYWYNSSTGYTDENVHTRQMEKLDRGLIAIKTDGGVYLSWRLFDSEDNIFGSADKNVSFNVYRDGKKISEVATKTNYVDSTVGKNYSVAPVINGVEGEKCNAVTVYNNSYFDIPLLKPDDETIYDPSGTELATYSFFPADCSTGDVDGDGEYEIIVKWTSSEHDVGSPGNPAYSGTVHLAAYKLDGTKLWKNDIELGKNVYSSAHTVQFLVYDFDGDGKSEVMCQTSLGSKDGQGKYVSNAAQTDEEIKAITDEENSTADYRGYGRITEGKEFLTVFNGETGVAMDTINLPTTRGSENGVDYGDDFGNRSNRFVSDIAYLDGEKPYAIYLRGYYFGRNGKQRTSIAGISWDGTALSPTYRFDTQKGQEGYYDGAYQYVGNGNHNCTVADVDNDGKDEFITGALCMEVNDDNEFRPKWCTYLQHGDALHIGNYDPTHTGFEFFTVHEDSGTNSLSGNDITLDFGMSVIDAETGNIMFHEGASADTGRGVMANVGAGGYYQIWSAKNSARQSNGGTDFTTATSLTGRNTPSMNFRIFWDGDLYDNLLDGANITDWNGRNMSNIFSARNYDCVSINGTKANPSLQADLFGDWREEVVYPTTNGTALRVFSTTDTTDYKIKTLMQDPVYRSGVAAEQTAYNQPPHVGFYMGKEVFDTRTLTSIAVTTQPTKTSYVPGESFDRTGMVVKANYSDGTSEEINTYTVSEIDKDIIGEQTLTVSYLGKTTDLKITVKSVSRITAQTSKSIYYLGENIDKNTITVTAYYSDGTSSVLNSNEFEVTGFGNTLGKQTLTVTYLDKTAYLTIQLLEANIAALNKLYETSSTTSELTTAQIGSYSGDFTLEHTVKINSIPANGNTDKNNAAGFFVRFMADKQTGGGWYLTKKSDTELNVAWKNTRASSVGTIKLGETYTFRYNFTNVGNGNGATVTLTILDSSGNTVISASGLNLRNFSDTDFGKKSPITYVQIYNQANANSTSSVEFANARYYTTSEISVSGQNVALSIGCLTDMKGYAAKYSNGILTDLADITPEKAGQSSVLLQFEPDKVFIWNDMTPVDFWQKTE